MQKLDRSRENMKRTLYRKTIPVAAEESFVSFSNSRAFAVLPVPRDIYAECSVYMEMASIGSFARVSSNE